ncbi:unnamed protein product [Soboliphyme baturini]|uniref:DUF5753 domain-containing protein n=1 Tax=Soboliphyme baturini TaxID=241478 RepID=A0A183ICS6_9BILA|nr:unnamed protein product [Soboliphyme baturini]
MSAIRTCSPPSGSGGEAARQRLPKIDRRRRTYESAMELLLVVTEGIRQRDVIIACRKRLHENDNDNELYSEPTVGNWNIFSLRGKEQELIDEAIRYQGSETLNLCWWKPFYSGVGITMSAQASVGALVEPNLYHRITEWEPVEGRVAIIRLQPQQTIALLQTLKPSLEGEYDSFLEKVRLF